MENSGINSNDAGSIAMYFNYYSRLWNQQNMLQDKTRTRTYFEAITKNSIDFKDKIIMDIGAGTGILSLFAASVGAKKVYV